MYRLHIGIPTYGKPASEFAIDSLAPMLYHIGRRHPEIEEVTLQRDVRTYRQEARQGIVEGAKHVNATHLLMLDDDHTFDGQVFETVWNAMHTHEKRPQVVGALYMTRNVNGCAPCMFKLTGAGTAPMFFYPENELFPVDVIGFGFILFDMEIYHKLNSPYFNLGFGFGEDAAWCDRLKHAGIQVYCHTGAKMGHISEAATVVTEADYLRRRESMYAGLREQSGGEPSEVAASELMSTGPKQVEQGYALGSGPWWRPNPSRIWKRDAELGSPAVREGIREKYYTGTKPETRGPVLISSPPEKGKANEKETERQCLRG